MHDELIRSYLFAPGSDERLLEKVFAADADAVVLDLEDAVAPERKEGARHLVAAALARRNAGSRPPAWVRINRVDGQEWRRDLEAVVGPGLAGVRVPKAESPRQIEAVEERLARLEFELGLEPGALGITPTVESAAGVLAAAKLAAAPRVERLAFGMADFLADVAADPTEEGAILYACSHLVLVSRAAALPPPIAPAHTGLDDLEELHRSSLRFRRLGFFGRSCIHPSQLAAVHEVFSPGEEEVSEAREVLRVYEEALRGESAVARGRGGAFVDRAVSRRARATLELAERLAARRGAEVS